MVEGNAARLAFVLFRVSTRRRGWSPPLRTPLSEKACAKVRQLSLDPTLEVSQRSFK